MKQYIGFKLNENEFTLPILKVREIINTPLITSLPQTPSYMKGVINIRGGIVSVIDLKDLINLPSAEESGSKIIIISNDDQLYGILVDSITSVININESDIEAPKGFFHNIDKVQGVAKLDDRLVILLDTDKLIETEGLQIAGEAGLLEVGHAMDDTVTLQAADELPALEEGHSKKPAAKSAAKSAAKDKEITENAENRDKESIMENTGIDDSLKAAQEVMKEKYKGDAHKERLIHSIVDLLDMLASRNFDAADRYITEIIKSTEGGLYKEVGQVTRKLHNSIREFKKTLDPRIKQIANEEVPLAVDSLEYVMKLTAESSSKTMSIVEKYLEKMQEFDKTVAKIKAPKGSVKFLKDFSVSLSADLSELMVAQEYQDITSQSIVKVINLVNAIETELVGLIATFGVKMDLAPKAEPRKPERIGQDDIDALLNEFGF